MRNYFLDTYLESHRTEIKHAIGIKQTIEIKQAIEIKISLIFDLFYL